MRTVGRTNEMRLYDIIHLTRKHLFNITLASMQTEHYILDNTGLATTIIYLFNIWELTSEQVGWKPIHQYIM